MPAARISMRQIIEVLRLKYEMDLAHATPLPTTPEPVVVAELAVPASLVAVALHIFCPEQLQGDALGL